MTPLPDPAVYPLDHLALRGKRDAPALVLKDGVLSHEGLNQRVGQLASWLAAQPGAAPGARVATWLGKGLIACIMPLAAVRAGLVHVPINPVLRRAQAAHILADSGAALLLGNAGRLETLLPGDAAAAAVHDEAAVLAALDAQQQLPPSAALPHTLAAILYTSGSTGKPKGVMLSQANLWLGAISVAHYLGLAADDRVLAVLPLAFDYGQNQLLSAWAAGGCAVPLDYLMPRDVVRAVTRHGITTLAGVPPLWLQLIECAWPEHAGQTLRRLTNSGGALTPDLVRRLRTLFPAARLFAMYGLTEAFRSTYLDPALIDAHPTAIGTAIPFAEVMVVSDAGTAAADGEEGELVHAGPLVAQGYWQDNARTAERFRPAPSFSQMGGIAVWSGDRVRRDAQGLLHFVGRRDAMIKTSGHRVSPQEVEEAALATGLVAEVVALGLPDVVLGQAIHLVCRATPGAGEDDAALRAAMAQDVPAFMLPRAVHWRAALPLSANGKHDRAGLYADLYHALTGRA
ncbi:MULTISPECIES: acyl-CoA ligase (AMP-forming), exosortase A system-associated [unclassified Novosphingobium]|uniref:acyl-CoA ligase (AMP-forming), exosortase A system-associated n=1 Tax=unclassified Novosphingobium TaxID=2644732 RepID=UPI000D313CB0|nr:MULTISPECIES: acyl-CoA ligase (AMP-forming), exosortase A system-associated [unclassified Novosphingobium]PTR12773.1 acyl-CoA ligase (AMP-forming) (exosortase A-associated) [Novosphingobium sp. GV055]PUB06557.1 acyl-CoA ligase (AMP-forming) (exosortase A-associated) [Novosphingobium sp. GV061]PUB22608.1 acyl-CoA ligase (AMP-forming) (exosortase A-associated) [Novosphingobium sp. GV079]PUB44633.1 acyl-CoA ligase (AMP-forming) (exosortase A-associated) [Novosphingobium sp. GV027]